MSFKILRRQWASVNPIRHRHALANRFAADPDGLWESIWPHSRTEFVEDWRMDWRELQRHVDGTLEPISLSIASRLWGELRWLVLFIAL